MIDDDQSIFWDKIVSREDNLDSVKWLKETLQEVYQNVFWARQLQDTDHVESLPGRVERVGEFPVQRSAEGEDQEAGGVQEVEAQQDGEVPQEAIRTSD